MILETNYKIVEYGTNLHLDVRYASVETLDASPDMLEKACSRLRSRAGLAAVVCGDRLLVLSRKEFAEQTLEGDDWRMIVKDAGTAKRLRFSNYKDRKLMALLVERAMLAQIGRQNSLWTLDSPRIWYEEEPFLTIGGIRAYRRYEVSAEIIEEVGIGIAVNVSTAFFTVDPVSYFFDRSVPEEERAQRIKRFERLSERQKGMKGTLLYKPDERASKCWFVDFQNGKTCGSESTNFKLHGELFDSLLDYYNRRRPNAKIRAEESVARVSFQSLGSKQNSNGGSQRPVQVSADRLWLRVTNKVLPKQLQNADKIAPQFRVDLTDEFWRSFQDVRLGGQVHVTKEYWRPDSNNVMHVKSPNLVFGGGKILQSPPNGKLSDHQDFFRQRRKFLDKAGCWNVPTAIGRVIPFAISERVGADAAKRFTDDLIDRVARWTGKDMQSKEVSYSDFDDAFTQINANSWKPGVSVFVFENGDPENYYRVAQGLKSWRVKRVTLENFRKNYRNLSEAENQSQQRQPSGRGNYRRRGNSLEKERQRAIRDWNSFIDMCALDVLEQLGCVPWGIAGSALNYEAHLAIDVGEEGRHFALTLLICRPGVRSEPLFRIQTRVFPKTNFKQENINRLVLRDAIVTLFKMVAGGGRAFPAINSLLVLRDGRECGEELEAINDARELLVQEGWLTGGAKLDVVDFHKSSLKGIRLWQRSADDSIENVLEGLALFLSQKKVVLATTGAATVRNGTANPVMLEARTDGVDMKKVSEDVFAGCQFNFSSPGKAHRLHIALRRCDEEIRRFEAQEIKRLK
jgi:hypothetical protein